jgi:hypothetical protein
MRPRPYHRTHQTHATTTASQMMKAWIMMPQIGDIIGMEADDVIDPYEAASKRPVVLIKFNSCKIAFMAHGVHGMTRQELARVAHLVMLASF